MKTFRLWTCGVILSGAMLALALLDLPFDAKKPDVKFEQARMTFTPAGPAVAPPEAPPAAPSPGARILRGARAA